MATRNGLSSLRRTGGFGLTGAARRATTAQLLQRARVGALSRRQASNMARSRGMGRKGG